MRIDATRLPGWHQVLGLAPDGAALSHPLDCHAFALETGAGVILFDAGAAHAPEQTLAAWAASGLPPPAHLFLTHGHADHSGGAALFRARFGTQVHAGAVTADWVARGDAAALSLDRARAAGIYPPDYRYRPCATDHVAVAGSGIEIGCALIMPIATPGHSSDHHSYLVTTPALRVLIAGDALFAGGTVVLQDTWDCSVPQTCASVRTLSGYQFDALLAGHGALVPWGARDHVDLALNQLARLLPPMQLSLK